MTAPQQAILAGRQPTGFNLEKLKRISIPLAWPRLREVLGFAQVAASCSADQTS